jgi:23S rRNA (guanosine2251-2'-O)-methyltransferase
MKVIILENIRSTFNVGSVFRTADGAGIDKIYLVGITPLPTHPKIKKTALGAEEFVSWEYRKEINSLIEELKMNDYTIYSVEQSNNSIDYRDQKKHDKMAFIFGNELTGVEPTTMQRSDKILEIPMMGKKNSLNISTTVGIILYQYI